MSFVSSFKLFFRRSPLVRTLVWLVAILFLISAVSIIGHNVKRKPSISSINPSVGSPGDIMIISGQNFGETRGSSYVELSGSRLTASGYLAWTDTQIKIILPSNIQDGLVLVGTSAGKSAPEFFANEAGIPVAVRPDVQTTIPVIDSISPETAAVGDVVTITGSNFGALRGTSSVFFTANRDITAGAATNVPVIAGKQSDNDAEKKNEFIAASETDYDYEFWSDTEIHVRLPDGAADGTVYVQTDKGSSSTKKIAVNFDIGQKKYSTKRTYIIQVSADVANAVAASDATVTLYVPRPPVTSLQPMVDLTECFPEPLIKDDKRLIIHQKQLSQLGSRKQRFTQNFVVSDYTMTSNIKSQRVHEFTDKKRLLYTAYTGADQLVPVYSSTVDSLRQLILGNATNPYTQAKLIYNYLIANYKIENTVRTGNVSVLDLPSLKKGDAYDFAILYTALCRSAGIPAVPVSGILVEDNSISRNHWWTEIYFEGYGWFPVDVALGAGLNYKPFSPVDNPMSYYFGNLDSQHVAFSRGWNEIKPSLTGSKIVHRPRTYALQSIWEEAANSTTSYSSLWNDPVILGIY